MSKAQKFRKRPVVIEAMQWTGDNVNDLWDWAGAGGIVYGTVGGNPLRLYVAANDAWLDLEVSEWILRDSLGFYPCKADIFAANYELAESPAEPTNHAYTAHGHACCGYAVLGERPNAIARCGGPGLCGKCREDVARIHAQ